ncbi:MAG: hypothetical protein ACR2J3_04590 [Aridibacter sp.]
MSNFSKSFLRLFLFVAFCTAAVNISASDFTNPVLKKTNAGCTADNLQPERFTSEVNQNERQKLCQAIDKITNKLNATRWSPALSNELQNIWRVFSSQAVTLHLMPSGVSTRAAAMAKPFPAGGNADKFSAGVYVRPEKSGKTSFFQVFLHELRHVYDFHETWANKTVVNSLELERRAYLLASKLTQETLEKESLSDIRNFWKESWQNLPAAEISARRDTAIAKFLHGSKYYRHFEQDPTKKMLDFSYLKTSAASNTFQYADKSGNKEGGRLPLRRLPPATSSLLPQNIRETNFNLEKPKNPRDEKEILRVALSNEKKLYYGMSSFVYNQKLAFQCWKKGKVSASFVEDNRVARTENGDALLETISPQPSPDASSCILNSRNLKTDFTETFWASPALDKMPIDFAGFVQVGGKTLARYTVLQPNAKLFQQLTEQYANIKPFRIFVGTIFISPEDGQIVRFWGTSFPEEMVTGSHKQKVWGSYSVTAVRQKLNIDGGLWVTVHIGTVAVANIGGNARPFSYTVKFENYRQEMTDVVILDDVAVSDANSPTDKTGGRR